MGKPNPEEIYIDGGQSKSEGSDDYYRVIWTSKRYRIIRCADDIQYIIQRKESDRWRSFKFCFNQLELDLECGRLNLPVNDSQTPLGYPPSPVRDKSTPTYLKPKLEAEGSLYGA